KLSRKSILNIIDLVKLILGKKVWASWEWKLPKAPRSKQRYFTQEELQKIINAAQGQNRVLFALLGGTGMRISEAAGLRVDDLDLANCVIHVRRGVVVPSCCGSTSRAARRVALFQRAMAPL